jgi:hypothetical protein
MVAHRLPPSSTQQWSTECGASSCCCRSNRSPNGRPTIRASRHGLSYSLPGRAQMGATMETALLTLAQSVAEQLTTCAWPERQRLLNKGSLTYPQRNTETLSGSYSKFRSLSPGPLLLEIRSKRRLSEAALAAYTYVVCSSSTWERHYATCSATSSS